MVYNLQMTVDHPVSALSVYTYRGIRVGIFT